MELEENSLPLVDQENLDIKKNTLYKQQYRKKQKEMNQVGYIPTLIQQAKIDLRQKYDFDLKKLMADVLYQDSLDELQVRQLKDYVRNTKANQKNKVSNQENQSKLDEQLKNETMNLTHQNNQIISNHLQNVSSTEERVAVVRDLIKTNLWGMIHYLDQIKPTGKELLEVIVSECKMADPYVATQLFVKICKITHAEIANIEPSLIEETMIFLIQNPLEYDSAYGLLRMIIQNQIDLTSFNLEIVKDFQEIFVDTIRNFFRNHSLFKHKGVPHLASTCYCFTKPIMKSLKQGGDLLYQNVMPDLVFYLLQIVFYSFNSDEEQLIQFMDLFRQLTLQHGSLLKNNGIKDLLLAIADKTRQEEQGFFKTLASPIKILDHIFKLANNNKLQPFDEIFIEQLLEVNPHIFQQMNQAPKILKELSETKLMKILFHFIKNNPDLNIDSEVLSSKLTDDEKILINSVGIQNLYSSQHIFFKYCSNCIVNPINLFQLDTGQGKTVLCYLLAIKVAQNNGIAFIVNRSADLTFRDFKKCFSMAGKLGVQVFNLKEDQPLEDIENGIVYLTADVFLKYFAQKNEDQLHDYFFIFDEFDNLFFGDQNMAQSFLVILKKLRNVYGLTGSLLQQQHIEFLSKYVETKVINFSLADSDKVLTIMNASTVYQTIPLFRQAILELCLEQRHLSPIIIINDSQNENLYKYLKGKKIQIDNLSNILPQQIESHLEQFTVKNNNQYGVVLISKEQGRGIDFLTNEEIESQGGVYLIIADAPDYFLQYQQFIGRTSRNGNRGQATIILYDKDSAGKSGDTYFKQLLGTLKNEDLSRVTSFQIDKPVDLNAVEEQKENYHKVDEIIENEIPAPVNIIIIPQEEFQNQIIDDQPKPILNIVDEQKLPVKEQNILIKRLHLQKNEEKKQGVKKREMKHGLLELKKQAVNSKMTYSFIKKIEDGYFDNYAKNEIHKDMIDDKARMDAYDHALKAVSDGKVMMEVGTGTGVLALISSRAGAKKVYAIEMTDQARHARDTVQLAGLHNIIQVIQGRVEEVEIPDVKVDIIYSEWMGYFLIYENMLQSVLIAKDRFLKQGGTMIPKSAAIVMAAYSSEANDALKEQFATEDSLGHNFCNEIIQEKFLISKEVEIFNINLNNAVSFDNSFESSFILEILSDGLMGGFISWFDAELLSDIHLITSPKLAPTHWKQQVFKIKKPFAVLAGSNIKCKIDCKPQDQNYRALRMQISFILPGKRIYSVETFYMD